MTGRGGGGGRRVLLPPINMIFKLLQSIQASHSILVASVDLEWDAPIDPVSLAAAAFTHGTALPKYEPCRTLSNAFSQNATVSVWLYEQLSIRIEGKIRGFDEFMNLVIDDAVEVAQVTKANEKETRRSLGQILLKGDNVSLIQNLSA
ncbi:LSM domain-containing protein [Moelleriella libera RCEF 2490]|uniref:Small nuclear ribonucleoprotein E n=1 Tax=Moelleriella libera RCEF 2490 TaxID=1081109 RepID=A0A167Y3F0_9HYPO|nr:LSM domain-containing protein [Moelleriella libera RCEF 2490]